MAKREIKTDLWVYDLLKEAELDLCPQGSDIAELDKALKTASKAQTGKAGYPEYCGVVKDFVIVVEDKADRTVAMDCWVFRSGIYIGKLPNSFNAIRSTVAPLIVFFLITFWNSGDK